MPKKRPVIARNKNPPPPNDTEVIVISSDSDETSPPPDHSHPPPPPAPPPPAPPILPLRVVPALSTQLGRPHSPPSPPLIPLKRQLSDGGAAAVAAISAARINIVNSTVARQMDQRYLELNEVVFSRLASQVRSLKRLSECPICHSPSLVPWLYVLYLQLDYFAD
ncbi:hypothetical protein AURDEDRAFT_175459 [Auricularia subglabra TFB-10046 SS5]|uniref:Uncharacterized protein n=1 Tax=Auricularia subglabra (strain TFB-10046 / SS5) TaxID=717982 RepID=J0LEY2_AURST|nr:hypothetical protein AURDEDRAFT_175459 [Auricularia subglabra TFB-10046 SS5]